MISFDYSWFLAKNISNFVSLPWKLHNRYCHNLELQTITKMASFWIKYSELPRNSYIVWYFDRICAIWRSILIQAKKSIFSYLPRLSWSITCHYSPKKMQKVHKHQVVLYQITSLPGVKVVNSRRVLSISIHTFLDKGGVISEGILKLVPSSKEWTKSLSLSLNF